MPADRAGRRARAQEPASGRLSHAYFKATNDYLLDHGVHPQHVVQVNAILAQYLNPSDGGGAGDNTPSAIQSLSGDRAFAGDRRSAWPGMSLATPLAVGKIVRAVFCQRPADPGPRDGGDLSEKRDDRAGSRVSEPRRRRVIGLCHSVDAIM
jgi:hypothetical protein